MYYTREWRYARNASVRREAEDECQRLVTNILIKFCEYTKKRILYYRVAVNRIDEQLFCNRNPLVPSVIRFHPYDPWLAVADKEGCT